MLHSVVDDLIQSPRVKLRREGEVTTEWHTLPSLWDMLTSSSGRSGGQGSTIASSRPIISTAVVSLVAEIQLTVDDYAPRRIVRADDGRLNIPAMLRAITATPEDPDWWTKNIRAWISMARHCLGISPSLPRSIHGRPCPACGEATARRKDNGEYVRTPALEVEWEVPGDSSTYHLDTDWRVRAITCLACGTAWWRGHDMDQLVEQMLEANATREVLAAAPTPRFVLCAGSPSEANQWMTNQAISPSQVLVVVTADSVKGIRIDPASVVYVGSFMFREDAQQILDAIDRAERGE